MMSTMHQVALWSRIHLPIPQSGRSPKVGNGNRLWYSCLESSMNREAWWAIVHRITKSWTLSD